MSRPDLAQLFDDAPAAASSPAPRKVDLGALYDAAPANYSDSPTRWSQKLGEGMAPGFNRLAAAAQAATDPLIPGRQETWGPTFGERYAEHLRANAGQSDATQRDHPYVSAALQTAGSVPTALATPGAKLGLEASTAERGLHGLMTGAGTGAAYGVGDTRSNDVSGILGDLLRGAGFGGAIGGPVSLAARPVPSILAEIQAADKAAAGATNTARLAEYLRAKYAKPEEAVSETPVTVRPNLLRRVAEATTDPTPEARYLESRGVPLTLGQRNPRSAIGQIEEASTSKPHIGPEIAAQREAGRRAWQDVVLREGLPPGMKPLKPGLPAAEQLDAMYQGFDPAYAQVKGEMVYPAIHADGKGVPLQGTPKTPGAFDMAVADKTINATATERSNAARFLNDQLTILPKRSGAVGKVAVEDLMDVRSNIRKAISKAVRQQDYTTGDLLSNGERAVTQAIETQLSPETSALLRATDSKYRIYKILEDAVSRSGDSPSGFSPAQLTQAVKASIDRGEFARGGGDDLRQLSKAGRVVFESVSPPTGARLLTVGQLGEYVTGPMTWGANRPPKVINVQPPGGRPPTPVLPGLAEAAAGERTGRALLPLEARMPIGLRATTASDPSQGEWEQQNRQGQPPSHDPNASTTGARSATPGNSKALWGLMQQGPAGIQALGPYSSVLSGAAAKGPESLAAAQYVLWNTDPKFRDQVGQANGGKP